MAEFKDRLKELRKEKGYTQQQLADLFNGSDVAIMRYEKGQREPKLGYSMLSKLESGEQDNPSKFSLIALAEFFHVSTDYLLGLSDIRKFEIDLSTISTSVLLKEIERRCGK